MEGTDANHFCKRRENVSRGLVSQHPAWPQRRAPDAHRRTNPVASENSHQYTGIQYVSWFSFS